MPHYKILMMFILLKDNLEKIIALANKFKDLHELGGINSEYYDFIEYEYQSDYNEMILAIDELNSLVERMRIYLRIEAIN
ncbi:hypothetical protein Y788_17440 [Pantoea dispersa 625]|nr:hypothetical protein Y788_17440 [Pantoea dispersa 625]